MGSPVHWDYVLRIKPDAGYTHVFLYRWQRDQTTRFTWLQTTIPCGLERHDEGAVLQELYTALLELMTMVS